MIPHLDVLAALMTLISINLVARKKRIGFLVGAAAEPVWCYLMWRAEYWGLFSLGVVFFVQYFWAYIKWRREGVK